MHIEIVNQQASRLVDEAKSMQILKVVLKTLSNI